MRKDLIDNEDDGDIAEKIFQTFFFRKKHIILRIFILDINLWVNSWLYQ